MSRSPGPLIGGVLVVLAIAVCGCAAVAPPSPTGRAMTAEELAGLMAARVEDDPGSGFVHLVSPTHTVTFVEGSDLALVNGRSCLLSAPVFRLDGRVWIPGDVVRNIPGAGVRVSDRVFRPVEPSPRPVGASPVGFLEEQVLHPEGEGEGVMGVDEPLDRSFDIEPPVGDVGGVELPEGLEVRRPRRWRYIVIHHSATDRGGADSFDRAHRRRGWENGLGYHFVLGNGTDTGNGEIEIGSRWSGQIDGAHAGVSKYNQEGIGICLVGNFDRTRPSPAQWRSLVALVRWLAVRFGIPPERVVVHHAVRRGTACPGRFFPIGALRRAL